MIFKFLFKEPRVVIVKNLTSDHEYCHTYLTLDSNFRKSILKIENSETHYSKHKLFTQINILRLINSKKSVPTSKLIKHGVYNGKLWILISFIDGQPIEQNNNINRLQYLSSQLIENIHNISLKGFGYITTTKNFLIQGKFYRWEEYLTDRFNYNINSMNQIIPSHEIKIIKEYIKNNIGQINYKDKKGVLLHNDIKSDNLIYESKKEVLYIIDWEEAIIGDPLAEYAVILNRISNKQLPNFFSKKEWYCSDTIKFYRICFLINEIGWIIRHNPKDNDPKHKMKKLLQLINV